MCLGPSTLRSWSRRHTSVSYSWRDWWKSIWFSELRFFWTFTIAPRAPTASQYVNCSVSDRKALQRVVKTVPVHYCHSTPCQWSCTEQSESVEGCSIVRDTSQPDHRLFALLLSGRLYKNPRPADSGTASSLSCHLVELCIMVISHCSYCQYCIICLSVSTTCFLYTYHYYTYAHYSALYFFLHLDFALSS